MAYTKLDVIQQAYSEIGLGSYVFDADAEELQYALRQLDSMMAQWNGKGIRLGYSLPSAYNKSSLADDINVPDMALEAMYKGLAVRLSPALGKMPSLDTKSLAKQGYLMLLGRSAYPMEKTIDNRMVPAGQGHKSWRYEHDPYLEKTAKPVDAGPDDELEFE